MRYALSRSLTRSHPIAQDGARCDKAGEMHHQRMYTIGGDEREVQHCLVHFMQRFAASIGNKLN